MFGPFVLMFGRYVVAFAGHGESRSGYHHRRHLRPFRLGARAWAGK